MPEKWLAVQREEFKRLGVAGEWERPYSTMAFEAEARIAAEIMKFAANGLLYRGSKPVMWSVVEKTALAEAEVEYEDHVKRHGFRGVSSQGRCCVRRDLDDDAMDAAGQSRDLVLA